jgi:putative endonuclease
LPCPAATSKFSEAIQARTQSLAARKKLNVIRTINPEFKDLAQPWGWKMITAHEKMYP